MGTTSIPQLIAAINPDLYYEAKGERDEAKKSLKEFKQLIKEKGIVKAAEDAKPQALKYNVSSVGEFQLNTVSGNEASHKLTYESYAESLEPIYFFILDLMNDMGMGAEKLVDNFFSSPGSTQWQEASQRKGIVQQQAYKVMGDISTVLRSVLNIVYDLRDFKMRLQLYDDYGNLDGEDKKSALLALKQLWLDKVDIQKGNSSIKAMALGQASFVTLIDAFVSVNTVQDAEKLDLNERVKRILMPRIKEFKIWLEQSEKELRKRFEIERNYLKSQVSSLKLYSKWAKPYLVAASNLESEDINSKAALVKAFNRVLFEVTLFGKSSINIENAALGGDLPMEFRKKKFRGYNSCTLVDFNFRAVPGQGAFMGRVDVKFSAYALNDDEVETLKKALEESDLGDILKLIQGATDDSLEQLQKEIEEFIGEDEPQEEVKKKEKKKANSSDKNPFLALIGHYSDEKVEKREMKEGGSKSKEIQIPTPDSWIEGEHLRPLAATGAINTTFNLFNVYKKAHGMPSYI